ncbi:DNA polymerase [Pyrodictium occultum]|uniref:Type-4 uracil-DNA glycosylase n=1 Tax=Pyrodictium occultum TaxID=2309 RepID=A0A0V8RUV9_PYROC|nr:type-4 uracil-DNA glycosylase [Pyrodictium occultum]KSW11824.1 DNA polymerase [Pyrodictium occultum]
MTGQDVEREYRKLVDEIKTCTRCRLHRTRRNPVPGEGPLDAKVMVVGEAPGRNEDLQGRPFVGAAGQLLNKLLELAGLERKEVYITNVVKCRPPGNRDPREDEVEACLPYLLRQIQLIRPRLVIAVGRHAARRLLELAGHPWHSMGSQHGKVYRGRIAGVDLAIAVTYHPAAALYKPPLRKKLEEDFRGPIARIVAEIKSEERRERRGKERGGQSTLLDFLSGGAARDRG